MTSPEKMQHIPKVKTAPERVLEETEKVEKTPKKERLTQEEVGAQVEELLELSADRAEILYDIKKVWGGLTKKEREELKAVGEEAVITRLESLNIPQKLRKLREPKETELAETEEQIKELASTPEVLKAYKDRFENLKGTLAEVLAFEHLQKELFTVESTEQELRSFYEQPGKSPSRMARKKLEELSNRVAKLKEELHGFKLDEATIDMLRRREIRGMQRDLANYSFAETEMRTELIREILPDLMQGAPVLFQGETGSGKTQLAKYISQKYLGKKPTVISISEQIKESQILGARGLEAGETVFKYSEFVKAQKEGRPVILDEINLMPHEFAGILHDFLQKRVGDVWTHPTTGEQIPITAPIMATANLKSERYKQRYELDVATLRRFIGGAGAREIHYLDIGKKDKAGGYIAPETLKILGAVLADKHGNIEWSETKAPQKMDELKRFVAACRKIQEDFTLSIREGGEETLARTNRLAFRELVITLKDQIEIMKAWKAGGFGEPLQEIILREFFRKAEISGRAAKDRENMVRVFIANKFFKDTKPEDFKIQGLAAQSIRQWQGKE